MPKQNIEAVNISAMTAEQRDAALALDVERLLRFGRKHKLIKELDAIVARNTLLDLLGLAQPSEEKVPKEDFDTPAALLDEMVELAAAKGLFDRVETLLEHLGKNARVLSGFCKINTA